MTEAEFLESVAKTLEASAAVESMRTIVQSK